MRIRIQQLKLMRIHADPQPWIRHKAWGPQPIGERRRPWLASEVLLVVDSRNQPNSRAERSLSWSRPTAVAVILIVGGGDQAGARHHPELDP